MSEAEVFAPEGGELSARERLYAQAGQAREGRRSLAAVLLALAAFGMVLSVSAWQVTGEGTALPLLRSALASLTDIDQFVAEHGEALRTEAARSEGPSDVPGYPLPVVLDAAEVREADDAALRTLLLDRSAALVYAEGLEAFDRTGEQAIDRLSVEGLLELAAGQLSSDTHARAGAAAAVFAVAVAMLGAMLGALSEGWSRMRAPAAAVGLGGVAAAGLSFAAWVVAGQIGGSDAFMADLRQVVQAGLSAGTRNGAIVAGAGLAAAAAAWALEALERRAAREPGAAVEEAPLEQEGREAS
ncbi:MAG: hypothetical protein KatS3mg062_0979 [Tepidiforma sp.]|nr:MAG: hypothetical protein KatS3mg062_0979 [Tepidiforma sp.]